MEQGIIDRIELILQINRLTRGGASKVLGLGSSNFGNMLKGKQKITDKTLRLISEKFNVSFEWLLTGDGEMAYAPHQNKNNDSVTLVPTVPLINLDARGGYLDNLEQGEEYVERLIPWQNAKEGDFAIAVSGTSMMPQILPGSYVLLRTVEGWQQFLEYNILYVLELLDYRRLLKLVQSSLNEDCITLVSYNPENPPQDIKLSFIRRVFKVVGIMTNYGF